MALGDFCVPSSTLRQAVSWLLAIWEAGVHGRKVAGGAEHSYCPVSSSLKLCVHPGEICVGMELAHMDGPASAGQQIIFLCIHGKDLSFCSTIYEKYSVYCILVFLGQMWGNFSILDANYFSLLTIFLTELFTLITWQISAVFLDAGKVDIFH